MRVSTPAPQTRTDGGSSSQSPEQMCGAGQARQSRGFPRRACRQKGHMFGGTLRRLPGVGGSPSRRYRRENRTPNTQTVLLCARQAAHKLHYPGFREVGDENVRENKPVKGNFTHFCARADSLITGTAGHTC